MKTDVFIHYNDFSRKKKITKSFFEWKSDKMKTIGETGIRGDDTK